jgi:hypothetical protein
MHKKVWSLAQYRHYSFQVHSIFTFKNKSSNIIGSVINNTTLEKQKGFEGEKIRDCDLILCQCLQHRFANSYLRLGEVQLSFPTLSMKEEKNLQCNILHKAFKTKRFESWRMIYTVHVYTLGTCRECRYQYGF